MQVKNTINLPKNIEFKQTFLKVFFFYFSILMLIFTLFIKVIQTEANYTQVIIFFTLGSCLLINSSKATLFAVNHKVINAQVNFFNKFSFSLEELERLTHQRNEWSFHLKNKKVYVFDTDNLRGEDVPRFKQLMEQIQKIKS